jgi:hypothetical protein
MTQRGLATIKFFEHQETIEKRMHKLRFVKIVYRELKEEGIIDYSYEQFRTLCNRHILDGCNNSNAKKTTHSEQFKPPKKTINPAPTKHDSFRRKKNVIHDPTMTDERRKELF